MYCLGALTHDSLPLILFLEILINHSFLLFGIGIGIESSLILGDREFQIFLVTLRFIKMDVKKHANLSLSQYFIFFRSRGESTFQNFNWFFSSKALWLKIPRAWLTWAQNLLFKVVSLPDFSTLSYLGLLGEIPNFPANRLRFKPKAKTPSCWAYRTWKPTIS